MNDKLRRIDPLIRRAEERRNSVAKEYASRIRSLSAHEQRLTDLMRFSDEYAQWPIGDSLSPAQLGNRTAFRGRLGQAVDAQRKQVDQSRSSAEVERARLSLASRDSKIVNKLADNYRVEQRQIDDKRAQQVIDDYAGTAHRRRTLEDAE